MFEKFIVLREAADKLYNYFIPCYKNYVRTVGFITAIVLVPIATVVMPMIFLRRGNDNNDSNSSFDVNKALAGASVIALLKGTQEALITMLTTSTIQVMKTDNLERLMDKSKFLLHGRNQEFSSMQYITVGVGVRDFATNAIPIFVSFPMYLVSTVSTLVYIAVISESFITSGVIMTFVSTTGIIRYIIGKKYFSHQTNNQNIENELVAKVAFIESNRESLSIMDAIDQERSQMMKKLYLVDNTIPKLSILVFFNNSLISITTAIASQFLEGYYKTEKVSTMNASLLNVMILSLLSNIQDIVSILTNNYSYVKLNLEQLQAFDKAYQDSLSILNTHHSMKQQFSGNTLILKNLSIYKPDIDYFKPLALTTLLDHLNIELPSNKIYKLSAGSGKGKTTFLKAITNNWQYVEGVVNFPENAKGKICVIPQHSFIPPGTLLEILTYPSKLEKSMVHNSHSARQVAETKCYIPIRMSDDDLKSSDHLEEENTINITLIINKAKYLLTKSRLIPDVINESEIELENMDWRSRLSGGEKQKIGIIRAILLNTSFLIMDEATSALDHTNSQLMYQLIKENIRLLENYMVIYTSHGTVEDFADAVINISGQTLEYHNI